MSLGAIIADEIVGFYRARPLTLVTGADFTHGASLLQLVASVVRHEPNSRLYVYDLGLTPAQKNQVLEIAPNAMLRRFEFNRFPDWFNIRVEAGQYAWKPTIVGEVLKEAPGPVVWMDAGNIVRGRLNRLYGRVVRKGFYSPNSSGDLAKWTHELTLSYFGLDKRWAAGRRNVNGACVAFDPSHARGRALAEEWARLALVREAIAPLGSSRVNHRQDQALLGVLAHRSGLISNRKEHRMKYETQQDID